MNPYDKNALLACILDRPRQLICHQAQIRNLIVQLTSGNTRALTLLGPRRIGKTLLCDILSHPDRPWEHILEPSVAEDHLALSTLFFIHVDFQKIGIMGGLIAILYQQLTAWLHDHLNLEDVALLPHVMAPQQSTLDELRTEVGRVYEKMSRRGTIDELKADFEHTYGSDSVRQMEKILCTLHSWGIRLIFLLDNLDQSRIGAGPETFISDFRRADFDQLCYLMPYCQMIIMTKDPLSDLVTPDIFSSDFFARLEPAPRLSVLIEPEARNLVECPVDCESISQEQRFSSDAVTFLLELTGRHPKLLRGSCEYLYPMLDELQLNKQPLTRASKSFVEGLLRDHFTDFFAILWHDLDRMQRLEEHVPGLTPDQELVLMFARGRGRRSQHRISKALTYSGIIQFSSGTYDLFADLFKSYVLEHDPGTVERKPPPAAESSSDPEQLASAKKVRDLLGLIRQHRGEFVTRRTLITTLYGLDPQDPAMDHYNNAFDQLMRRLRDVLKDTPEMIVNERWKGYRLVARDTASSSAQDEPAITMVSSDDR